MRPVGTAFTNTATHQSLQLTSGTLAAVAVTGLAAGTNHHWQARTVDSNGNQSDWTPFGGNPESSADVSITASANTTPGAPTGPAQFRADGTTAIAGGATTNESTVVFSGVLSDPDGDGTRMLLELRPVATPFNGTPTHRGDFGATTIVVTGLAAGGWHWQIATEDAEGAVSTFTAPGGSPDFTVNLAGNTNPGTPTAADQLEPPATPLGVGGSIQGTDMAFQGTVSDADGAARLEIEVRPLGTAFTGTPTGVSGFVASGTPVTVAIGGLTGDYHWQYRAVDGSGGSSAWTSFGGNPETDADFSTNVAPADPVIRKKNKSCGASEGGSPLATALVAVIGLILMRRRKPATR